MAWAHNFHGMDRPIVQPPVGEVLQNNRGRQNRKDLSREERRRIVQFFLQNCSILDGVHVPARGTLVAAANFFGIDRTI